MNKTGKGYFKRLEISDEEFYQLYFVDGWPLNRLATKFGVLPTSINMMRKRRGIPKRPRSLTIFKKNSHWRWKGGKVLTDEGYVLIKMPEHPAARSNGYVLEHRLVMEKHLKRFLRPDEVVDHINGVKDDNRIENLKLFIRRGEHIKEEWKRGRYANR